MKNRSGIFLLEAVVSMALLAAGAVALSQTFPAGNRLERSSHEAFISSLRIQTKLFELERAGGVRVGTEEGVFSESSDRWKRTVTASPVAGLGLVRLEILDGRGNLLTGGRVEVLAPLRRDS